MQATLVGLLIVELPAEVGLVAVMMVAAAAVELGLVPVVPFYVDVFLQAPSVFCKSSQPKDGNTRTGNSPFRTYPLLLS